MRKWMRERLQRRKKKPTEKSEQPAPPPLQPAYFDAASPSAPALESQQRESEPSHQPEQEISVPAAAGVESAQSDSDPEEHRTEQSSASPSQAKQPAPRSLAQGNRGRRRRGGRGRGGRGREQAVAQAFAPASMKGATPSATDSAEGESDSGESDSSPAAETSPNIPPVPAAQPRPPKGIVVLAIGLPGSGKSSWFKRHNIVPLSSDMMRSLLFDDIREQRYQDLVFSNLRSMLKARLIAKRPMNYVDATNLTPKEREHWIKLAKDYNYEVHAVFFDVPLEVCIERHQRRDRVVPDDAMRRMAAKLKPPTFNEGFAKITVVRVKKSAPEGQTENPSES
jgi:predicted kinase